MDNSCRCCLTAAGFISGYGLGPSLNGDAVLKIGVALAVVGFVIRWAAIFSLGKFFTVDVEISDQHRLKTEGIYKIVRHPSYLGLVLIVAALWNLYTKPGVATGTYNSYSYSNELSHYCRGKSINKRLWRATIHCLQQKNFKINSLDILI